MIERKTREQVSYHEAGHAVVASALGIKVYWVHTIVDSGSDWKGETRAGPQEDEKVTDPKLLAFLVCVAVGGRAADLIVCDLDDWWDVPDCKDDRCLALESWKDLTEVGDLRPYVDEVAFPRALATLTDERQRLDAVAKRLLEAGSIWKPADLTEFGL